MFSAYTYTGNGGAQTINNGIDLAGKGGMVWTKGRNTVTHHGLYDTARGATKYFSSNLTNVETTWADGLTSFTSTGYTLGADAATESTNANTYTYVSHTFRKAPKFFDVVTYTGDGSGSRFISHSLGIIPGMFIMKSTSATGRWYVASRDSSQADKYFIGCDLNTNAASSGTGSYDVSIHVSSTSIRVTAFDMALNTPGVNYVMYLFAHDPSADGLIQCGSFTNAVAGTTVTLGWEPQYVMFKRTDSSGAWAIYDSMRGFNVSGGGKRLNSNLLDAEYDAEYIKPTATGFEVTNSLGTPSTYIYLAIHRPNKPPTLGTQVYNAIARTGTSAAATVTGVGFAPDLVMSQARGLNIAPNCFWDRLRGPKLRLRSDGSTDAEFDPSSNSTNGDFLSLTMDGATLGSSLYEYANKNGAAYINHFFKRAPGVFDVVCYGYSVSGSVPHSLGGSPELVIIKNRGLTTDWWVRVESASGANKESRLNMTNGFSNWGLINAGTNTSFSVSGDASVNGVVYTYVAYLFATKPGISKVGSYTGNGSSQTINAGFSTGARFIMIKRTDSTGDWFVWDTVRGIVVSNDPHLSLNTTSAEVTTDDSIDPDSTGSIVNQNTATNINVTSASYIYLSFA